jgi:uncharacterized protein YbjT (DUF2867 family)
MRRAHAHAAARLAAIGAEVQRLDLQDAGGLEAAMSGCDSVVFANRLELTARALKEFDPRERPLIAFSSNNVAIHGDSATYRAIADAEAELRRRAPHATIIRPTLIYGDPRLPTVPRLIRIARSWPFIPLPGTGKARVQPVFHEDLATLVAGLIQSKKAGATLAVGGPDVVTMRAFFAAIQAAVGVRRPIISIAGPALGLAAALNVAGFTGEQAARAERDRIAVSPDEIPSALVPRVPLQDGLARLARALA